MARLLIAKGIDLKQTDVNGMNALMILFFFSQNEKIVRVAQLLISNGIDVKQTDKYGRSTLDVFQGRPRAYSISDNNKIAMIDLLK